MLFELINWIISVIFFYFFILGCGYLSIHLVKRKGLKKASLKQIKKIEDKIINISKTSWNALKSFGSLLISLFLAVVLAMGVKPIIFKLNFPLGEGYAIFGSYVIAIILFSIFRGKKI